MNKLILIVAALALTSMPALASPEHGRGVDAAPYPSSTYGVAVSHAHRHHAKRDTDSDSQQSKTG